MSQPRSMKSIENTPSLHIQSVTVTVSWYQWVKWNGIRNDGNLKSIDRKDIVYFGQVLFELHLSLLADRHDSNGWQGCLKFKDNIVRQIRWNSLLRISHWRKLRIFYFDQTIMFELYWSLSVYLLWSISLYFLLWTPCVFRLVRQ